MHDSKSELLKEKRNLLRGNIREYGMTFALLFIIVLFGFLTKGVLFRPMNVSNIVMQNSYILILSVGMFFCIMTGNVDLSVGSVVALTGSVMGSLVVRGSLPVAAGIILTILLGIFIGAFQGFFIAFLKVPPFIVTLAGMLIFRGLTIIILDGQSIAPFPKSIQYIASGFVFPELRVNGFSIVMLIFGFVFALGYIFVELTNRRNKQKYKFDIIPNYALVLRILVVITAISLITYSLAAYNGLPFILIIIMLIILIYSFIANKTIAGRHVYAMGGNENAARLSGIKTHLVMFFVYTNMGFIASLTGIIVAARLNAAVPKAGNGFELDAIAACLIGGCSAAGGFGTPIGAIIGALVMGVLNNGMSIIGLGPDLQQVIKGFILLLAVTFDIYSKSKTAKR